MTSLNKRKWLHWIMVASVLLLLATALVSIKRVQDQKAYELLAEQRELQLMDERSAAMSGSIKNQSSNSSASRPDPFHTDQNNSRNDPAGVTQTYIYQENINKKWLSINSDFMGWLQIPGSNIDYPFVRSKDNADYLKRDFYGNYSESGTLFMDYRNLGNFNDQHTLIYGHNMKNKSMFHDLIYYQNADYFSDNQVISLSGLYETKTYRVFSVYEISADDYAFTLDFDNDSQYLYYLIGLERLSLHSQDMELDAEQRLLTLVTCSYGVNNGRTIVHAIEMPE